jgi:hypothetical protein
MTKTLQITLYFIAAYLACFGTLFVFAPGLAAQITHTTHDPTLNLLYGQYTLTVWPRHELQAAPQCFHVRFQSCQCIVQSTQFPLSICGRKTGRLIGVLEPLDDDHCVLTVGGDTYETVAALIVQAGVEFTLLEPQELARAALARRRKFSGGSGDGSA